jgi:23S rRNA-/tRNA-specific pseudouridylate synthase
MKPTVVAAVENPSSPEGEIRLHRHEGGPERLDRALARAFPDLSRSRLQALAREGRVQVDDEAVRDPGQKIRVGALLSLLVPPRCAYKTKCEQPAFGWENNYFCTLCERNMKTTIHLFIE